MIELIIFAQSSDKPSGKKFKRNVKKCVKNVHFNSLGSNPAFLLSRLWWQFD